MPCRHQSLKYRDGNHVSCNRRWLGFKVLTFLKKYLSVTRFFICSQLRESSEQPQLWYHLAFNVNFEEGLLPPQFFFLSVASLHALVQRCSLMKYGTYIGRPSFKINDLHIFGKLSEKHIQHNYKLSACALTKWFFRKFSKSIFKEYSWWDTSDFVWLFLKNFQNTF